MRIMSGKEFERLEKESHYINERLVKLMQEIGTHDKTKWTIDIIKKLQQNKIGEPERLNVIKMALDEGKPVDKGEIDYLKDKYKILKTTLDNNTKIQWTLDVIKKLQGYEIGDPERLSRIKKALEEGKQVDKDEIDYIKQKYNMLQKIS